MELWKELHNRALNNKGESDIQYLQTFGHRIPRYTSGCKCKEFWTNWLKQHPPIFDQNGGYFKWTVEAHNAVNAKLGKKIYTVEEAKSFYSK